MNVQRDPDAILAAWLDEGPTRLPEPTRRAIAVIHPNHQSNAAPELVAVEGSDLEWNDPIRPRGSGRRGRRRRGTLFPQTRRPISREASAAPASPAPSASPCHRRHRRQRPTPSPPPSPEPSVGALTQRIHVAHVRLLDRATRPAGRSTPTTRGLGPSPLRRRRLRLRGRGLVRPRLSRVVPDGVVGRCLDPSRRLQQSNDRRMHASIVEHARNPVTDRRPRRPVSGSCGTRLAPQIEAIRSSSATAPISSRLYDRPECASRVTRLGRCSTRSAATITLDPQSARASPSPSPS